jgi:hypothetical protein
MHHNKLIMQGANDFLLAIDRGGAPWGFEGGCPHKPQGFFQKKKRLKIKI